MSLAERLAARASAREATAQVDCGELGSVTVEALPVRELELLLQEPDGQRAVFYAACRELQTAGEELRREGKIFTPYGIMQFVSESEAAAAAQTVLELNGQLLDLESRGRKFKSNETRLSFVQDDSEAVRPSSVQNGEGDSGDETETRLASVQMNGGLPEGFGQVSRETGADFSKNNKKFARTQALGDLSAEQAQNVVSNETDAPNLSVDSRDPAGGLHEITSEYPERGDRALHEITSEFRKKRGVGLHETESEFSRSLHESESEFSRNLHESESEFGEERRLRLHETESEYAERLARALLEGLQRAKWVRGG